MAGRCSTDDGGLERHRSLRVERECDRETDGKLYGQTVGRKLSASSYQLSAISYQLSEVLADISAASRHL
jgi:hypothetical protein